MNKDIEDILGYIYTVNDNALKAYYLGRNLGKIKSKEEYDVRHVIGFMQRSLQNSIILDLMKILDHRNTNYKQKTMEMLIEMIPSNSTEIKGSRYGMSHLKSKDNTPIEIRKRFLKKLNNIRKRPYVKSLRTIRNKALAHAQVFDAGLLKPVTWNNILKLLNDIEKFVIEFHLIIDNANFVPGTRERHFGSYVASVLNKIQRT